MKKLYFDLTEPLPCDTYLTVKFGLKWVHYNIPRMKVNGELRTYGELYNFYTTKPDFKMAMCYMRMEEGDYWTAEGRYCYWDKKQMPHLIETKIKNKMYLKKSTK